MKKSLHIKTFTYGDQVFIPVADVLNIVRYFFDDEDAIEAIEKSLEEYVD